MPYHRACAYRAATFATNGKTVVSMHAVRADAAALSPRFGVALRAGRGPGRELEELAEQARRDDRDRIDAQHRRARRTHDLIGEADQPLVAAASEDLPEDRDLPEHVVEAVEGHDGAAHVHFVVEIVYEAA